MKRILVTGSNGFIGQSLCPALDQLGYTVYAVDRSLNGDLCDKTFVDSLPDVDIVVHLAARNGTKHFYNRPFDVVRDGVLPTQYLLERYAGKIERFVFTGTCESYAGAVDLFDYPVPTDETVPLVISDITNPRWSYGASKIVNEAQVIAAKQQLGQDYAIIRYHNVYGPGQRDHFIPEFYERVNKGDFTLYGWENTRSFIYITDAIAATIKVIIEEAFNNEIVNIGRTEEISILDLAKKILKTAGIDGELVLKDAPKGSVRRRCANISKFNRLTHFVPEVDLNEGIKLTLESLK